MSILMRSSGRSAPRARRTWIRYVAEPGSRSAGPAQQAVTEPDFAALLCLLPAVQLGHARLERDVHDPPE